MENKSNSLNRIKRHQREKVLRFSIRKYSFGAASVAVAALMFLGARVVSADTVSGSNSQSTAGVVQPNDKGDSPVGIKEPTENKSEVVNSSLENKETALVENSSNTVDKSQLRTVVEELNSLLSTKLNLDDSVLSSVKERVQRAQALLDKADAVQKDINELKELLSADLATLSNAVKESSEVRESNTGTEAEKPAIQPSSEVRASEESQTVSAKKDALKVSVDQLKAAISEVPEHDTTKGVLEKANELLGVAQVVLENTTVSLNDVEEMTKRVKRMFISVKNATTRLTSGTHDPRNGQRIAKGTGFRADRERVEGPLYNVKEYISEPAGGGSTVEGNRPRTIEKVFMKAKYSTEGNQKFITYDVYFHNDGKALGGEFVGDAFWFYPPRDLLYNVGGNYPVGLVSDAYYERYEKKPGTTGTLSQNPNNFTQVGGRYTVPLIAGKNQDYGSQSLWGSAGGIFEFGGGPTRPNQRQQMLKKLENNPDLNRIIRLNNDPNGPYPRGSYSHLLTISKHQNFAYKYHVKMRLRDNVTEAEAQRAGAMAVSAKAGGGTTAYEAYVYAATGTRLVSKPATPRIPTNLTGKAGTRTQIEVDAEAGVSVVVYDHGGKELGRREANASGKAFITPSKDIPSGNVTAKAIDKAGNVSDPSNPQVATAPVPNPITVSPFTHGDTSVTLRPNGKTDIVYATIRGNGIKYEKQANGNYRELSNPSRMSFKANQDGTITIGLPQGQQLQAGDRVVTRAENSDITSNTGTRASGETEGYGQLKRSDKVHVKDPSNLSPTDKERVKAAVLKANPGIKVADLTIAQNGDVTYNHRGEGSNGKREIRLKDNVVLDNVAPGKPTIETPLLGKAGTRTSITVQTEAGAKVELFDSKNRKIGEKVADKQGRVTIEPKIDLVAGNVTAKATDEAGNISQPSDPKQVTYPLTNQPIINIKQGENLTAAEIKQTVLLQNANGTTNLPNNAQVTGNFDTSSVGVKRTTVTVRFPDAPEQQVEVTYKVLPTFPIARTVYDFKGMDHGNDESGYYVNPRNLPSGMVWVAKRNGEQEQSASKLREMLKADPVGTKTYTFSGKYNHGRFTNTPNDAQKLAHTGTFEHKVFDVEANRTRVTVSKGATLTEQNAKDAVTKVAGSEDLPTGTTYEWVDNHGNKQNPVANTPGVQNYRVKVTLPMSQTGANQPDATQKRPSKIIDVKVNVKPDVPTYNTTIKANGNIKVPTVASTDRELTGTGAPGAKIKVTVPGVTINEVTVGNNGKWTVTLPKGLNSNQLNQTQLVPQDPVTITQSVDGVESDPVNVAVSLGETTIQPSVASKDGVSLVAGTKNIVVKTPHDAGMVYVSYTDKATGKAHEIGLKRENINSPWVSIKPTLGVVTNTSKDAFTNNITIEMKESIAEGTAKAIANISEGKYSSAVDWKTIQVTNQAPTVTSAVSGNEKIVEFGENIDLKTLVTKADYEDDKDATRGTKVRTEIVSVNGQNNVKDINSRKPGTYIVKYKAIDSQGKESGEIQLTVKVREDKPTPPTATAPSDGTVTVTPTGDADKVIVNYTDEKNAQKTVTVVKAKNGTWSSSDKPAGVTVDSSTGQLLIPAEGVKDKSQVTATATKGDSHPSEPTTVTAQAKDFTPVKPDEKVVVQDKSHLTPEEKKQVEDKVKAKNPGKTVTVGDDGTATVTDPSTKISHPIAGKDLVIEDFTPVKPDEKVVVQDKSHLTPEEKKQVEDKVKAKNPGKTVTVGDDGTATVTDPSTKISHPIAGKDLVNQDFTPVKPDEKVVVQDKSHLTPEEKKQVEDKVKAKNPGKTVTVGDDGTATVTDPTTKISHPIAGKDLVNQDFTPVKPDEKVVVQDKSHLTPEEKKQVEDKVKAKNPGKTVTVGDDGTATVTDPSTKISHPIAGKDLVNQDFTPVKPDEKVVVQDKSHLTPEEKKQVEDKVKAKNPGKTVTVGDDGTATVTDPSTKISHPIAGKDLVIEDFTPVKPDEKVVVQDKSHLTPEEKKQVEDKVKAKNPGKTVTVGDDGTATVTDPSTKISHPIAGKDLVIEDFTPVKPDEKVVVQDKSHLTPEEKKQVEDKVKAKNPGKTVTVGDDGTATVTDPSTKISHPIAGKDLVIEDFTPVKPDEKVVVQDKSHLTPEEKKQVEDKVKAKNPGKTVTVGDDGTATVTDPSTKISHPIAGKDLVIEDFTPVKPDEKVVVQDKSHLTPEEKKQVEDKVKAKNPGKTVTVGDDGTATVTDPSTKISHPIAGKDLVNQDFTPVKPDEKVVVQDKSHLTPEEKKQVEDKVKAKNPGKTVTVGDDGTATVTDPSTKISHPIAGKDLVIEDFTPVKPDEKVVVQDKSHLTPEEKKQVEDKVKAKNPGKTVTVGDDGTATVTDPSTKISHPIAGKDLVIEDFTPVKPDEKVVVQDKSHLTPEEKKQVEDKVKAKNPGKTVTVGDDGTATVTDPSTKISHPIAGKDLVIEDFTPVKPDEKVVVQDKSHLTPEEKKQVEDKVKAKNPGKTVTVGDDGTATVTDPSTKISHPIAGKDLVNQDFTPVKPDEKVVVQDKSHLTPEEKKQVEDKVKAKNPGKTVTVGDDGTATVTDPSTKISHPIAGKDLVNEGFGVNGIPEVTPSQPEYTDPVGTSSTDGNGNLIDPPTVELPEFNGGVNGELPDPVELPKVKLIITKWIDEQGNELKPADAKAPAVLGEANEAFEHGEIEGYVFVRTDVNEEGDVVTHVFRKVTPTKPEGNGEQQGGDNTPQPTPEVPTDNIERKPETEKPTVPDTKQVEQSTQTVDAQVAPSQNQAVLPNTGTKADRATGALGALSLLGAFGLLFAKKKKDDEEETRNN